MVAHTIGLNALNLESLIRLNVLFATAEESHILRQCLKMSVFWALKAARLEQLALKPVQNKSGLNVTLVTRSASVILIVRPP